MTHKYKNVCYVCGTEYEYCERCVLVKPTYNANRFCSQEHQDIFAILSKHGCHLATAEETLEALKGYDTTGLTESVQAHIDSLQPKKAEVEVKEVEAKKEIVSYSGVI